MATEAYLTGRKKYQRPEGILWSDNSGTLVNGFYVPIGYEVGTDPEEIDDQDLANQFLILSDHNRSPMQFNQNRIEKRQRTINGRMRSYHISDKITFNVSWTMLPSRGFSSIADFNPNTGLSPYTNTTDEYTADGGAGGVELLDWYQNHQGPFWMFLAYDRYDNFGKNTEGFDTDNFQKYSQIVQVYFADFNYTVSKRGGSNFDLWDISVALEEV